jgi:hypothetical protein
MEKTPVTGFVASAGENRKDGGTHENQLPNPSNKSSLPDALTSMIQEVVPYANSDVKVDWARGTDFSKYKTYAWGIPNQKASDPNHPLDDIDAAL